MTQRTNQLAQRLKEITSACPYTALGKRAVRAFKREPATPTTVGEFPSRVRARITLGRNIALIGFFCPFFWGSLLGGARAQTVCLNASHSAIVMLVGLVVMAQGKFALKRLSGLKVDRIGGMSNRVYTNRLIPH